MEYRIELGIALLVVWLGLRFYMKRRYRMKRKLWEEERAAEEAKNSAEPGDKSDD